MRALNCAERAVHTRRGLATLRLPVPSLLYMSSALPALGKHSTRHLHKLRSASPIRGEAIFRLNIRNLATSFGMALWTSWCI